ncbi:MAG TPA: GntR family transcriptional regulator [Caulobacteraceae bacterium]|nr:GntR family transcriptional regulator [Caulobacteraceae bacterium]
MSTSALSRTVAERVTDALRNRILAGRYPPGSPLRQDAVAAELGVSRIPLREALNHLEAEGLVLGMAHRGFVVRQMSRTEADEVFSLRLQLEPVALAEGASIAAQSDVDEAERLLERLNVTARSDKAAAGEAARDLAIALVAPRLKPLTAELVLRLLTASQRYVSVHLNGQGAPIVSEFEALYEAWRKRRLEAVAELSMAQIGRIRERVMAALNQA